MAGTAILSLDCEGKWGVADHLRSDLSKRLSDERLKWSYREIVAHLDQWKVNATFAVVELFIWSRAEQLGGVLQELADLPFLREVPGAIANADEGWSAPWVLDLIGPQHEIATHGFSHTPWPELTAAQAQREMAGIAPERRRTLIYPRNGVAHTELLASFGCEGYRTARPARSRLLSLATEFNVFARAERPIDSCGVKPIPAGAFINWRGGARALVPPAVSRMRARHIIRDAARTGGVAHFWTHPENIATHPPTLENFKAVVEEIARARDAGEIEIVTQIEFCRQQSAV